MKSFPKISSLLLAISVWMRAGTVGLSADRSVEFGILYEPWQCMFTDQGRNHDIEEILAGRQEWGALFKYHWSGRPQLGYYCLSRDKQVLVKHAEQLRDAGVDFIAIDSTNSYYADPEAQHQVFDNRWWDPLTDPVKMVQQPVDALLEIWSGIPGAPKVVPFTPVKNDPSPQAKTITGTPCPKPDMQRFWNERLNPRTGRYKNMGFLYFGKPLWLASRARVKAPAHKCLDADGKHPFASDPEALADLSHFYTIRKMWGLLGSPERAGYSSEEWSFIENCQDRFKELNGSAPCNQRIAFYNGKPEELSVSAAYQRFPGSGYISDKATAVPKLNGATLHQQFNRFWDYPNLSIVFINSWNLWGAVRTPCNADAVAGCQNNLFPDGSAVFMDVYGDGYDSSLEPSTKEGDKYYRQLVNEIRAIKGGPAPR